MATSMPNRFACAALALSTPLAALAAPSAAELAQTIEQLQAQVAALAEAQEQNNSSAPSKLHWGGYGELHYNNISADDASRDNKQIDFHRFVLFAGYDFSNKLRLVSEIELEHSLVGDGKPGEVELEQAYLEMDVSDRLTVRGGLMLIPAGLINETHEPPVFYGVERNDVENIIVPSTWWAGGVAASLKLADGLQWDLMIHEGLKIPTSGSSAFRIRSGRQKTAEADAADLAYTSRLRYNGIAGLELGLALQYQSDISQVAGDGLDEGALYVAHAAWNKGIFAVRALYSAWKLGGLAVEAAGADSQTGWYLEPSVKISESIGVYARYEDLDAARGQDKFSQWEAGINYYPHPHVVLKADFRQREHELTADAGRDFDGFDLGIGYHF
ncbi:MAG: porin [Oceanococcus sp.]